MASRSVSFRLPPDVDAQFDLIKRSLGKQGDSEALVEIIRTYPVAWRPSTSALFRERPRGLGRGPPDGSRRYKEYLYGPVAPQVRREERRLTAAARKRAARRKAAPRKAGRARKTRQGQ